MLIRGHALLPDAFLKRQTLFKHLSLISIAHSDEKLVRQASGSPRFPNLT